MQDSTEKGHSGLASYYSQRGETPGGWMCSGMAGLEGLNVGDVVTAEQMQCLFGAGMHPLARKRMADLAGRGLVERDYLEVARLGVPFMIHTNDVSPFRVEVAKRLASLNLLDGLPARSKAVSYTHLTLPTNREV